MKRIALLCALVITLGGWRAAAQPLAVTLSGPSGVASANDFATNVFQDPWDMNERTDVGWWLNSIDAPFSGFSGTIFTAGMFSGTVNPATPPGGTCPGGDPNHCAIPNLWLLETGLPNLPPTAKNGNSFAINADLYHLVSVRMRVPAPGYMLFRWSTRTIYDAPGLQTAGIASSGAPQVPTTAGWRIYFVDLQALSLTPGGTEPWNGTKRSLRFDPVPGDATPGSVVDIDWIRLVDNQSALLRTVSWTGAGGPVDIYLDNDTTPTSDPNQTLGLLAQNVGSPYSLNAGALPAGTYYVAVRRTGTTDALVYSPTSLQVNGPATIKVTAPSDEGSADDFATVHLNNPWDMTSLADIDRTFNVAGPAIVTIPGAQTEAGNPLGDVTAFFGTSTPGTYNPGQCASGGDPIVYPLRSDERGRLAHIDPTRYRILTAELGLPDKARNLCGGSVARVFWHSDNAPAESHTWDIPINSRAGANVVNRINLDMSATTTLVDPGSPSQLPWVPGNGAKLVSFRLDPHEFADPTRFYMKRIKLAALQTVNSTYTIRWTASKVGGTVRAYYDTDQEPTVKTPIGSTTASALDGSLAWNTSALPQGGRYFVYVEFDDGVNVNGAYAKWPVVIEHNPPPTARIVLSRTALNFATRGATVRTPPQTVRLTALDAAAGQPCWTVGQPEQEFIQVTPRSGCGSALLTVSLVEPEYSPFTGEYSGSIVVTSTGAINSPQSLLTTVRTKASSTPPAGLIEAPTNGILISGSLGVTGWAIDDIGVAQVTVCRDPVAGEPAPPTSFCGPNQVFIGNAVFVDDARPDVAVYSPTTPLNYRAGWGLLILTNVLPNQGFGPGTGIYVLHARAFDVDGQYTDLGTRVINAQNATATEPFGAIDTPGQGETISGSAYPNFGWVLSRRSYANPPDGGSVVVYVDGVAVGSPGLWTSRSDLSGAFADYPGVDKALGVFGINTMAFGNGVHQIGWFVTDRDGAQSGVGSRFFSIFNEGGPQALASAEGVMRPRGADLGRQVDGLSTLMSADAVSMRQGFRLGGPAEPVPSGFDGGHRVWAVERQRLELRLGDHAPADASYAGYQLVDGRLSELPTGSSFDPDRGAFYWQPGLGYLGTFDLLFVRTRQDGVRERIPVQVTLQPRPALRASARGRWPHVEFRR